jgi:hypothetical protein
MRKLLALTIVVSLAFIMNNVSNAQEILPANVANVQEEQEATGTAIAVVDGEQVSCAPVPCRPLPCRPFVRRACTPCVANPCNPCPPCAPQPPICAPMPRKLCAPIQPPCQAEQCVSQCADPCGYGYGYVGYRPTPIRNFFARLFSRAHDHDPYYGYGGYGCPEFGYGTEYHQPCPCEHNHQ